MQRSMQASTIVQMQLQGQWLLQQISATAERLRLLLLSI